MTRRDAKALSARSVLRPVSALALAMGLCACGSPPVPAAPAAALKCPATATEPAAAATAAAPVVVPTLRYRIRPEPGPEPRVLVELVVSAPSSVDLRTFTIPRAGRALSDVRASDTAGALPVQVSMASGDAAQVAVSRPPVGALSIQYAVRASGDVQASASTLVVGDDRFRAPGERFVLMPVALADVPCEVTLDIDTGPLHVPEAATSFGVGKTRTRKALGRAAVMSGYLAGALGRASFEGSLERDEAAWLGYTAFDPRPAAAEIAGVRSALQELWRSEEPQYTVLFASSARPEGSYSVVPRASSMMVHLGPDETWSAPLRLGIAQTLARSWVGGAELRFGAQEQDWLYDGLARYLGAYLLSNTGLLSPDDTQRLLHGLLSVQATSPFRGKSMADLRKLAALDPRARAHVTAVAALHALRVAALLAQAGASPLPKVLRAFTQRVRDEHQRLPTEAWSSMLAKELGPAEARKLEDVLAGKDVELPSTTLGPCFAPAPASFAAFDLGFDPQTTADSEAREILGLDAAGPAARAGLSATDVLLASSFKDGDPSTPVVLTVQRSGQIKELRYKPLGPTRRGVSVARRPGKRDAECGALP